uniref:Uncharacterized protein n=1 Tax=Arundo donax TaxID=35708 RepID=A0A0A8Z8M1_ARUDO
MRWALTHLRRHLPQLWSLMPCSPHQSRLCCRRAQRVPLLWRATGGSTT